MNPRILITVEDGQIRVIADGCVEVYQCKEGEIQRLETEEHTIEDVTVFISRSLAK